MNAKTTCWKPETLLLVVDFLSAAEVAKCERICRNWNCILTAHQSLIWKTKLRQSVQLSSSPIARQWISSIILSENECWKAVYRCYHEWKSLDLRFFKEQNPFLIPTTIENISCCKRGPEHGLIEFKVGQVESGMVQPTSFLNQNVIYNYGWHHSYGLKILGWDNASGPIVDVKRFYYEFTNEFVASIYKVSSDLEAVMETARADNINKILLWDPSTTKEPQYFSNTEHSKEDNIWYLQGEFECIGLSSRTIVVKSFGQLFAFELGSFQTATGNSTRFNCSKNISLKWKTENLESFHAVLNESVVSVIHFENGNQFISLFWIKNGTLIRKFPVCLPVLAGFESVSWNIAMTRFHLIVHNANFMSIYDLFQICTINNEFTPKITKLPYLGRKIRIEISSDGSMFLIGPQKQHGEVILVDLFSKTFISYLLKDGFSRKYPKRGCWLVFQKSSEARRDLHTKVIWTPIEI